MLNKLKKSMNKGLDISENDIFQAIEHLYKKMPKKFSMPQAIDVCGTGGSGLKRINTSTISAIILGSVGVKVAKHGNKAASGRFGSFDLLESIGIPIELDKKILEQIYKDKNLAFIFARKFHPYMKHFAELRSKLGFPTIFNLLGPLLNPANTKKQIIGTTFKDKMDIIAKVCKKLRKSHVFIVCGEDGLDEVTLTGKTEVIEIKGSKIKKFQIQPKDFGIKKCKFKEIEGGNKKFNIKITKEILKGVCKSRHQDLVLINCSLALLLAGKVSDLKEGYKLALNEIVSGKANKYFLAYKKYLKRINLLNEIVGNKVSEIAKEKNNFKNIKKSSEDFKKAISGQRKKIIGEIKFNSPLTIKVLKEKSLKEIVKKYENLGVCAISVLTDKKYFKGDYKFIKQVKKNSKLPVLCKEFIVDEYQIYKARKYGADAVLLISSILKKEQILKFLNIIKKLNMHAVVEVHNLKELNKILKLPVEIIQINNRNLNNFSIDLKTTEKLVKRIPRNLKIISASGILSYEDLISLPNKVDAVLIGTALMNDKFNKSKLFKACGIRNLNEAEFCKKVGVNLIGLNFVSNSKRKISIKNAEKICKNIKIKKVGVFQNQKIEFVNKLSKKFNLDYIQLSGNESLSYIKKCNKPVIKSISVSNKSDLKKADKFLPYVSFIIFDAKKPGDGKPFNHNLLYNYSKPYILAGGINNNNIKSVLNNLKPIGIDAASGIETNKIIDLSKINKLNNVIKSLSN